MQFFKAILTYNTTTVEFPANKMTFFDELYVDCRLKENQSVFRR